MRARTAVKGLNVVHVVRQYLPSVGGLEEVVRNLAQQQARAGRYTPTVLTLNRVFRTGGTLLPAAETLDGVAVKRLGYAGSERYPLCPQVAGALRGADLVHVHGIEFFFDYLALLHPLMRTPLVASTHGGFFHSGFASRLKKIYFRTVTRLSARAYQKVIATSENDGDLFAPVVPKDRLVVIENGVDMGKFAGAAAPDLRPVMVYFGRWSVNKGLLECIDLLAELCRQQPNVPWQLMVAGREYDLNAQTLQDHAVAQGVGARITLFPNPGVAELRQLIGMASYFLCLSHHEGFGIAPIEAISAGLIPLLSPIPPFVRLFKTTAAGALLDAPTAAQQAQQVTLLHAQMAQAPRRQAAQQAATEAALQAYSWHGVAARYARQYDLALGLP
jgi:alpha-1,3-mannosyltransferase